MKYLNDVIITVQYYSFTKTAEDVSGEEKRKLKWLKSCIPPAYRAADMQGGFATVVEHFNLL